MFRRPLLVSFTVVSAMAPLVLGAAAASAAPALVRIHVDPYSSAGSQHATEVEPDSFAFGSTIVEASQVGRFFDGGAVNVGWATSTNSGATWTNGVLPGVTKAAGGPADRVSDASVAYDAAHNVWLISSLPLLSSPSVHATGVVTSRSTDGGLTWANPVTTATGSGLDKNWIACDNTPTSPYYGRCYTEFDDNAAGNRLKMSTSTDGGLTWGPARNTANNAGGIGGQPVVQPNGTVVVPTADANETKILAFTSTNGGASWSATTTVATISDHRVAGNLRTGPLPSAEVDAAGRVYVVWQDCRFRTNCPSNDIVLSTSTNGSVWSTPTRIPIDAVTTQIDHFIPGLAVDRSTSGASAHLALTYYFYPTASCSTATCALTVGFTSSPNGGASWTSAIQVAGPMTLSQIANTSQGPMVGDYISTSYSGGTAHGIFAVGRTPSGTAFDEAMYTTAAGLVAAASGALVPAGADRPVPGAHSDHAPAAAPVTRR